MLLFDKNCNKSNQTYIGQGLELTNHNDLDTAVKTDLIEGPESRFLVQFRII